MRGNSRFKKSSYYLNHGKYTEIKTSKYEFHFNLNGEIIFIRGLDKNWPHPSEHFKRTDGNDWVYYSVGDDSSENGIISWLGEYYLPCLPYSSNSIWEQNHLSNPEIMNAFAAWSQLYANLHGLPRPGLSSETGDCINQIIGNDETVLYHRSQELFSIMGERISVLPPDTRHVDYDVIPLMIADGCLYHCKFCCVQSADRFQARSRTNIAGQIQELKRFFGQNIKNYNALFLGNHDALQAGGEIIHFAATEAGTAFDFKESHGKKPMMFLFGSVDSFLKSENDLFDEIDRLPFYTYINIGLESIDAATLASIHKPISSDKVGNAFRKMIDINRLYKHIEVTANFLIGAELSPDHYESLTELLRSAPVAPRRKGAIYLSPLKDSPRKRELLPRFYEIKKQSPLPVHVYLIQRL